MFWISVRILVLNVIRARRGGKGRMKDEGKAKEAERKAYRLRTRISILIPEIKATSFPVLATRTPMCQSGTYPGAVNALPVSHGLKMRCFCRLTIAGTPSST
jgi:hypothetical protein